MEIKFAPFQAPSFHEILILLFIITAPIVVWKLARKDLFTPRYGENLSLAIITIFPSIIYWGWKSYCNWTRLSIYPDKIILCFITGPRILIKPEMVVGTPVRNGCKIIIKFLYYGKVETIKASVCDSEGIIAILHEWQKRNGCKT